MLLAAVKRGDPAPSTEDARSDQQGVNVTT